MGNQTRDIRQTVKKPAVYSEYLKYVILWCTKVIAPENFLITHNCTWPQWLQQFNCHTWKWTAFHLFSYSSSIIFCKLQQDQDTGIPAKCVTKCFNSKVAEVPTWSLLCFHSSVQFIPNQIPKSGDCAGCSTFSSLPSCSFFP